MGNDSTKLKRILFVDDEAAFLEQMRDIFAALSDGAWEIHTAQNHAQALALLQQQRMDLLVLDIGMPVVDGVQFLRLLNRAHPGQQVVMLTGLANEEKRKECLELGALLCLEKPTEPGGYESIHAALDALASSGGGTGFRGMMRQVGLQEVLQMECLGTKSSILEIVTGKTRGRIYIHDGVIIHAEKANLRGELALYSLLALRGGEFNLLPYTEPAERTIQGQWEFLLMEAARLQDEQSSGEGGTPPAVIETSSIETSGPERGAKNPARPAPSAMDSFPDLFKPAATAAAIPDGGPALPAPAVRKSAATAATETWIDNVASGESANVQIKEVLLCSGAGELLHEWQCKAIEARMNLIELAGQFGGQITATAALGRFERLEIRTQHDRSLCQIRLDRRLFVRSSGGRT